MRSAAMVQATWSTLGTVGRMHPADRLDATTEATGSIACVGLDPRPELLPPGLRDRHARASGSGAAGVAAAFREFNEAIIDAVAGRCAAVKPQAACYEAYGLAGWAALEATVTHAAAAGVPVILDAKRADIGSTATHYGQMAFGGAPGLDGSPVEGIGATWITVNPYLGADGVLPILGAGGVFVLVKTSNPSSADLQDVALADPDAGAGTVAERTADLVREWGAPRERMPDTVFLVPGYGAQGGGAADAVAGARSDGRGIVVSSSRAICGAWQETGSEDWAAAAARALDAMNADLDGVRRG
jgi:orotidine-5'-phosphate decarboxylase